MEAKENWISPDGYLLNINQITRDIITGNFEICLDKDRLFIPFEGLTNIYHNNQIEFCFVIDWHSYVANGTCYTSFTGKNYFENNIEHIILKWLLVCEMNKPEQNLRIRGRNKFLKVFERFNNQGLVKESNNLPHPFFIDVIKTKVSFGKI